MARFKITRVGVGAQLLLLVLAIACLTGGLVGVRSTDNARVALRDSALEHSFDSAELASAHVHEWVGGAETGVRDLASRSATREALSTNDNPTLTKELQQWLPMHTRLSNAFIVDLDGIIRVAGLQTFPVVGQVSIADRPYFQRVLATDKPSQWGPATSRLSGRATAPYAVPIDDSTGVLRAVLVSGIDLNPLSETLAHQGDITLVDMESGLVLAAPDPAEILQPYVLDPSILDRLATNGGGALELPATADQPARLVAFTAVADVPWVVLVQEPSVHAFAAVDGMVSQNFLLVTAVLLFAALLGSFWAWRIVRPLKKLRADAEAMAGGDLTRRARIARDDEVGDLARAFDHLADRLGTTIADLEAAAAFAEEGEGRIRAVMDRVADGILTVDPQGRIVSANAAVERMFGYEPLELLGLDVTSLLDAHVVVERLEPARDGEVVVTLGHKHDGQQFMVELAVSTVRVDGAEHSILVVRDATERHRFEEQLRHQAFHDALTGLPNRALFFDRLEAALVHGQTAVQSVAVLFVDLDNFKLVNDSLGHGAGDILLVEVARRLRESVRAEDTVARLGGDEFAILLEDEEGFESSIIATRIGVALREPLLIDGHPVITTASIGIAYSRPHHDKPEQLMSSADLALYKAKGQGKACFAVFDESLEAGAMERLALAGVQDRLG